MPDLRESLAEQEHKRWAGWQNHLHSKCTKNTDGSLTIPAEYVVNLEKQINTTYDNLSESERGSDREEADKTLAILERDLGCVREALALHKSMVLGGELTSPESNKIFQNAMETLNFTKP